MPVVQVETLILLYNVKSIKESLLISLKYSPPLETLKSTLLMDKSIGINIIGQNCLSFELRSTVGINAPVGSGIDVCYAKNSPRGSFFI